MEGVSDLSHQKTSGQTLDMLEEAAVKREILDPLLDRITGGFKYRTMKSAVPIFEFEDWGLK